MSIEPVFPPQDHTMQRLEQIKKVTDDGEEFWFARELAPVLGYPFWHNFETVVKRAATNLKAAGKNPAQFIERTETKILRGTNPDHKGRDYFLARVACYLIALNGDASKPEVATAKTYFAAQTRRMELLDIQALDTRPDDVKRLECRKEVSDAHKLASRAAEQAGVRSYRQPVFHEQRFRGLYNASSSDVHGKKGLSAKEHLFDRVGPLELSMHAYHMNLAADILTRENIQGEQNAMQKNLELARSLRAHVLSNNGTPPEDLPLMEPIANVRRRVTGKRAKASPSLDRTDPTASRQLSLLSPPSARASDS